MRNKGIVIELTALLDVILIMLFWVMMSMEKNNEKVRSDAAAQVAEYEQKYNDSQDELEDTRKEYEIVRSEFDHLLDATSDSVAVSNQKALDGFSSGKAMFVKIRYENDKAIMYIYSGTTEIVHSEITSNDDAVELMIDGIKKLGLTEKDTIICTFAFVGTDTSRTDTNYIRNAIKIIQQKYSRFNWTETSISR